MKNLYDILQVSETASKEIIEKSYKVLAKKYHPDVANDKTKAEEYMKDINVAYDTLSDDIKREEYDNQLKIQKKPKGPESMHYNQYNSNYYAHNPDHENFNFFNKIIHLDNETKKLLLIALIFIVAVSISLYFYVNDFINTYSIADELGNNNTQKVEIEDDVPKTIVKEYLNQILKEKTNTYYLQDNVEYKFNIFSNDDLNRKINDKLLSKTTIDILDDKVYESEAIIYIQINRIDVSYAFGRYYMNFWSRLYDEVSEQEKYNLLNSAIEEYSDKVEKYKDKIILERVDGEWKIKLKEYNIVNLYGFTIDKKI